MGYDCNLAHGSEGITKGAEMLKDGGTQETPSSLLSGKWRFSLL